MEIEKCPPANIRKMERSIFLNPGVPSVMGAVQMVTFCNWLDSWDKSYTSSSSDTA